MTRAPGNNATVHNISLWRYYGPGNAVFTGQSQGIWQGTHYYSWWLGEFHPGNCAHADARSSAPGGPQQALHV